MNIFTFTAYFGDETTCRLDFKSQRDKASVVCTKCDCTDLIGKKQMDL